MYGTGASKIIIPLDEFEFTFARSGGPGGQNVNKVNSKAILRWTVETSKLPNSVKSRFIERYGNRLTTAGELIISSQEFRDQTRNIQACIERITELIESVAVAPTVRRPSRPTLGSKIRRVESKHKTGAKKQQRSRPNLDD